MIRANTTASSLAGTVVVTDLSTTRWAKISVGSGRVTVISRRVGPAVFSDRSNAMSHPGLGARIVTACTSPETPRSIDGPRNEPSSLATGSLVPSHRLTHPPGAAAASVITPTISARARVLLIVDPPRGVWYRHAMTGFGSRTGDPRGSVVGRVPRSTVVVGALTLVVFMLVGLISCSLDDLGPRERPLAVRPDREPDIRVRVRDGASLVTVGGPGLLRLRWDGGSGVGSIGSPVEVSVDEVGALVLRAPLGEVFVHRPGAPVTISRPATEALTLDGHPYPGSVTLVPRTEGGGRTFDVVAQMGVEEYLPGVIAKELYQSWPLATFQAQAVCARSYALHERARSRRTGRAFDLEATTQDQAFIGATDLAVAHDAVESTRGQALTWEGQVLRAYYASTSGGRAASAADTWPTGPGYEFNLAPPLQAAPRAYADEKSPAYRWTRERGVARLSLRLRRWGEENGHPVKQVSRVRAIEPSRSNAVGRPTRYKVRDDQGRAFELSAEELRVACNWAVPGVPDVTAQERVRSGDLTARVRGDKVEIEGRGFGHGVGLCQFSAAEFARRGWGYREITLHFYPGARIERLYP